MPTEEQKNEWEALKSAWQNRRRRSMSPELFRGLFYDGSLSHEAIGLAEQSPFVRQSLKDAADGVLDLSDSDVWRVWLAVQDDETVEDLFAHRRKQLSAMNGARFVRDAVRHVIESKGRRFIKTRALKWWRDMADSEEQQEALIEGMIAGGIRDEGVFRALGSVALQIAHRAAGQNGDHLQMGSFPSPFGSLAANPASARVGSRFDALFADAMLVTDLRDACLTVEEHSRVAKLSHQSAPSWSAFARALRHLRHFPHPAMDEFADALAHFARVVPPLSRGAADKSQWRFPVLRLLHLQQILEAPHLSKALRDPSLVLVPDVALYLMGRDDILFQPELRVLRGSERRWRARWVESAGEAMATMFLEDSVQLDLSTLARMPERNDALTPDFMAATIGGGKLVFESKGSTEWKTHLSQRNHALKQLGKRESSTMNSWATDGRTFACSLFAAQQGDERSSLLHVDDPPFQFQDQFREGWESHCRREHAVAILEAARLFARADDVARQQRSESDSNREVTFRLPGGEGSEGESYLGTYLPMGDLARSLRHPNPRECERIRIFLGVQENLVRQFERGEFPGPREPFDSKGAAISPAREKGPKIGILPGREERGVARGMYSILADGAFMAVEFE